MYSERRNLDLMTTKVDLMTAKVDLMTAKVDLMTATVEHMIGRFFNDLSSHASSCMIE